MPPSDNSISVNNNNNNNNVYYQQTVQVKIDRNVTTKISTVFVYLGCNTGDIHYTIYPKLEVKNTLFLLNIPMHTAHNVK
jgi:hypothetical protein